MCELFGLTGPDEIVVNEYLETFASHSVDHPNGWGIALFCGKEVNIEKEPVAAYRSSYLKERLRTPLRASNMMAHIRFATRGHMAYENCHPFVRHDASGRAWTFMHKRHDLQLPAAQQIPVYPERSDGQRADPAVYDRSDQRRDRKAGPRPQRHRAL